MGKIGDAEMCGRVDLWLRGERYQDWMRFSFRETNDGDTMQAPDYLRNGEAAARLLSDLHRRPNILVDMHLCPGMALFQIHQLKEGQTWPEVIGNAENPGWERAALLSAYQACCKQEA